MSVVFRSHIALACRGPHVAPNHSATPVQKSLKTFVRVMSSLQIQSSEKALPRGTLYVMKRKRDSRNLQVPQEQQRDQATAVTVKEIVAFHMEVCEQPPPKWAEFNIGNINGC